MRTRGKATALSRLLHGEIDHHDLHLLAHFRLFLRRAEVDQYERVLPWGLASRGLFQLSSKSRLNVQLVRHQQSD
jgi:hypothetical protein